MRDNNGNLIIQYYTFDNQKIEHTTTYVNSMFIDYLGHIYASVTREVPDRVYLGLNLYKELFTDIRQSYPSTTLKEEQLYANMQFSFGIVRIIPVTKPHFDFILVGQDKDYNRYISDEIFEKEVLR